MTTMTILKNTSTVSNCQGESNPTGTRTLGNLRMSAQPDKQESTHALRPGRILREKQTRGHNTTMTMMTMPFCRMMIGVIMIMGTEAAKEYSWLDKGSEKPHQTYKDEYKKIKVGSPCGELAAAGTYTIQNSWANGYPWWKKNSYFIKAADDQEFPVIKINKTEIALEPTLGTIWHIRSAGGKILYQGTGPHAFDVENWVIVDGKSPAPAKSELHPLHKNAPGRESYELWKAEKKKQRLSESEVPETIRISGTHICDNSNGIYTRSQEVTNELIWKKDGWYIRLLRGSKSRSTWGVTNSSKGKIYYYGIGTDPSKVQKWEIGKGVKPCTLICIDVDAQDLQEEAEEDEKIDSQEPSTTARNADISEGQYQEMENQNRKQKLMIQEQDVRIREQDVKIREQDVKIREQDFKIREQDRKIREQELRFQNLTSQMSKDREQNQKLEKQNQKLVEQLRSIQDATTSKGAPGNDKSTQGNTWYGSLWK